MKVLVACEESQAVCNAFRELGHEAYSCDIQECSGKHPEWHILGDVLPIINGDCKFTTMDGAEHEVVGEWDLLIAHPPCTYLTVTGNRWFNEERYGEKAAERKRLREEAAKFFMQFANANCPRIAIENPIGYMSSRFRKPNQTIHPYYFSKYQNDENCERKATCLWLKGLPQLKYVIQFEPQIVYYKNGRKTDSKWHMETIRLPKEERTKARSKTFPGIAKAMAEQWGGIAEEALQ